GGQGQSQLAVAAEVDGATKAYDGRLGSGAVRGELGDGGGRGPFGVVDDPLSDTVLSGCKSRKKGADPKDRGRNGRGGCLGPVRAVFRWLRDVRHGGKFLSVVLKSQRGDGKKSGESRIPRDASGSKCFARGGVVPVQGFSSVGRAEAGEVLLVRRNTSVGRSIAALRIDSQVGAGRGRGKVSAEPGPPSPGAGGTPYSRPGPSFCGGMARRSKVRPTVARGVELCCKNRLIFVEGSSGLMG